VKKYETDPKAVSLKKIWKFMKRILWSVSYFFETDHEFHFLTKNLNLWN